MLDLKKWMLKVTGVLSGLYQVKTYTATKSVTGGAQVGITASEFGMSTPSGYSPVAVLVAESGSPNLCITNITGDSTGGVLWLRNIGSSSTTASAKIKILYIKSVVGGGTA